MTYKKWDFLTTKFGRAVKQFCNVRLPDLHMKFFVRSPSFICSFSFENWS